MPKVSDDHPALINLVAARKQLIAHLLKGSDSPEELRDRAFLEAIADQRWLTGDQELALSEIYFEDYEIEMPEEFWQSSLESPATN